MDDSAPDELRQEEKRQQFIHHSPARKSVAPQALSIFRLLDYVEGWYAKGLLMCCDYCFLARMGKT